MNPAPHSLTRRSFLGKASATTALAASGVSTLSANPKAKAFRFGLNMSTIRGQELDAAQEIETAGQAGYDAIEPWFRKIYAYVEAGGTLADLRKRIEDHGLTVESAIGFSKWIVDDESVRAEGFEEAKRDMDTIAQLGGTRIAAPPAGTRSPVDLDKAAERYHDLLVLGESMGVIPQVEMWGGHPAIGTVEKAVYVMRKSGHPKACFLGDVYHTYKGGSSFDEFRSLDAQAVQTFHMNDYPADPPQDKIKDEHRVYPGDGIAPIAELLRTFQEIDAYPVLSLELFNRSYWKQPALEVAKTGLAKMKAPVATLGS